MYKLLIPLAAFALAITGCTETPASTAVATKPVVAPASQRAAMPKPMAKPVAAKPTAAPVTAGTAMKIADVFAKKDTLAGKPVSVSGKVVKYNANIMGSNWLHIQDGSGAAGTNDLTVTTKGTAAVGETVTVIGLVSRNRDFGAGYKFDVIVENATLSK